MSIFTHLFIRDTRTEPVKEFHYQRHSFIPKTVKVAEYFAKEGIYDYKTFKSWMAKSKFTEIMAAGPYRHVWEDHFILVNIGPNSFSMEIPVLEKLELKMPTQEDYWSL
jgi:hypothetical protein